MPKFRVSLGLLLSLFGPVFASCQGSSKAPSIQLVSEPDKGSEASEEPSAAGESSNARVPGVSVIYRDSRGTQVRRVEPTLTFDRDTPPDPRLSEGALSASFSGWILVPEDGEYRFEFTTKGSLSGKIAGQELSSATSGRASSAMTLSAGYQTIEILVEGTEQMSLGAYWSGPDLPPEPLGHGVLFRRTQVDPSAAGKRSVAERACAACHPVAGLSAPRPASSLASAEWLPSSHAIVDKMTARSRASHESMPLFDLSKDDARAVAVALGARSIRKRQKRDPKIIRQGLELVVSRGCMACHGDDPSALAAPMRVAAARRSDAALGSFLEGGHRPGLELSRAENRAAVAYLSSLAEKSSSPTNEATSRELAARGREILQQRNCGACHELPERFVVTRAPPLHDRTLSTRRDWSQTCLDASDGRRPRYEISNDERKDLSAFLSRLPDSAQLSVFDRGQQIFERENCTRCHARDDSPGIAPKLPELVAKHSFLRGREAALRPPPLHSVGDKLSDRALMKAVVGELPRRRPWLSIRMPRFDLSEAEVEALKHYLISSDRLPDFFDAPTVLDRSKTQKLEAGHRLAGAQGFSCTSCHDVGEYRPDVDPNVHGPDLLSMRGIVREAWFDRWLAAPARRFPGVEMPAVTIGYPGILDGTRSAQIDALWSALSNPFFPPPVTTGVERELVVPPNSRALVVRDVFRVPPRGEGKETWIPRGMAVGLPGGHNVLFDLDRFSPVSWSTGALARERTRGKIWYWEAAGIPVLPTLSFGTTIALVSAKERRSPAQKQQTTGWLESWTESSDGAVSFKYRLRFRLHENREHWITVVETLSALSSGWQRKIRIRDVPKDWTPSLEAKVDASLAASLRDGNLICNTPRGRVEFNAPSPWILADQQSGPEFLAAVDAKDSDGVWTIEIDHVAAKAKTETGLIQNRDESIEKTSAVDVAVLPGFSGRRQALDLKIMPTAIAFSATGTPFVASLNGDIYRLTPPNAGGDIDEAQRIASRLSAPYGILVDKNEVLVSHKPEVVALADKDGDGYYESARVVASGWGHSDNYHDWTVGLVKRRSDLFVVLGSDYQQNGRKESTTMFRGKALLISPQGSVRQFARGLRFACGLAMRANGDIFATDNQGMGNTFNEINLIEPGKAYGVPSLYDPDADRKAVGSPAAIWLPHPWARSVNGIAFLEHPRFGVFQDHGVGCELDNRKLVRFSLERIHGVLQGACYPFSRPTEKGRGLLGPLSCAVSPDGDLYIGNIHDSGWGGGPNVGNIVRFRRDGDLPFGIAEVKARSDGFEVHFTQSAPATARVDDVTNYKLVAYRRVWKGGYGTDNQNQHEPPVAAAQLASDRKSVHLKVDELREGYLYEIHASWTGETFPNSAFYTLHRKP